MQGTKLFSPSGEVVWQDWNADDQAVLQAARWAKANLGITRSYGRTVDRQGNEVYSLAKGYRIVVYR